MGVVDLWDHGEWWSVLGVEYWQESMCSECMGKGSPVLVRTTPTLDVALEPGRTDTHALVTAKNGLSNAVTTIGTTKRCDDCRKDTKHHDKQVAIPQGKYLIVCVQRMYVVKRATKPPELRKHNRACRPWAPLDRSVLDGTVLDSARVTGCIVHVGLDNAGHYVYVGAHYQPGADPNVPPTRLTYIGKTLRN